MVSSGIHKHLTLVTHAVAFFPFHDVVPDCIVIILQCSIAVLTFLNVLLEVILIALRSPYCWDDYSEAQLS